MQKEALELADRNWKVLPIHSVNGNGCTCGKPDCGKPGKHPHIKKWQNEGTDDPDVIKGWFRKWPDMNIGVQTGSASRLIVIDVDPRHGGDDSLHEREKEHGELPPTKEVLTGGGGRHLPFKYDGKIKNSVGKLGPGLDIRGENGFVVAPPSVHESGRKYEWEVAGYDTEMPELPSWVVDRLDEPTVGGLASDLREPIPHGERQAAAVSFAGTLLKRFGPDPERIFPHLRLFIDENAEDGGNCPDSTLRQIAESVCGNYGGGVEGDLFKPGAICEHLTDWGNARRLVARHGDDLLFDYGRGGWLVWDQRRWKPDATAEIKRRAKQTAASIYPEAAAAGTDDERKAIAKHAIASESEMRRRAMISSAESEPGIPVVAEDLDADCWLFNCENGTVNLRNGELQPHNRDDRITKLAPVEYDPDAKSDLWDKFLRRITGGDSELSEFLRRAAGYTLTGDTGEEILLFPFGPEATGKSTLTEAMKAYMGDYAVTADFESFLARRGDAGIRNDIARLDSARLVLSLEVDDGKKLAEGLLKQITGGDTVAARFLHKEFFEFVPQFKLWLAANHRPEVRADDGAMWRRIVQIPFTEIIPEAERDPELKRRFKHDPDERAAILAWAVRGCLDWQEGGLQIPDRVRDYTAEYRAENDPLREWLAACCTLEPGAVVSAKDLRESYKSWGEENGEETTSNKSMATALRAHGCTPDRDGRRRLWVGVKLVDG